MSSLTSLPRSPQKIRKSSVTRRENKDTMKEALTDSACVGENLHHCGTNDSCSLCLDVMCSRVSVCGTVPATVYT